MATTLYVVIMSRGKWFVDVEGSSHGPYETRASAALEAKKLAEYMVSPTAPAEVIVPDEDGKFWVIWDSRESNAITKRALSARRKRAA
ncbi:MAG: DUF2188 domain-containing protein [Devosia sp.]